MKYGVFTVCLPEYTPEDGCALLKELGYDGVEWRVTDVPKEFPADVPHAGRYWGANHCTIDVNRIEELAPGLQTLAEKYGLQTFCLSTYLRPADTEKILSVIRAAASIGCGMIRLFQEGYTAKDDQKHYKLVMAETRAQLQLLEPALRENGVKAILEMHHDTIAPSPSAAWSLLCGLDPACFGINIDPGNMVYEGYENYQKAFELLGPFIAHVHVKNALLVADGRDELGSMKYKRTWAQLWDGSADLLECFRILKKFGYNGTVSVEDFTDELPTKEKLAADLAYIRKLEENA